MLNQFVSTRSVFWLVNQPFLVTSRAALFWTTWAALMMYPSVPPQTVIMYVSRDIIVEFATINLVLKVAFLDSFLSAFILGFS